MSVDIMQSCFVFQLMNHCCVWQMRALKDLGLGVTKGTVSTEGSVKQTKFSITKL